MPSPADTAAEEKKIYNPCLISLGFIELYKDKELFNKMFQPLSTFTSKSYYSQPFP